jgi:hypothetical protein
VRVLAICSVCVRTSQRQILVRGLDGFANSGKNAADWRSRANLVGHSTSALHLAVGNEKGGRRFGTQILVMNVDANADDFESFLIECFPDGIRMREKFLHQLLVDDGNLQGCFGIAGIKAATVQNRNTHGGEKVLTDTVVVMRSSLPRDLGRLGGNEIGLGNGGGDKLLAGESDRFQAGDEASFCSIWRCRTMSCGGG